MLEDKVKINQSWLDRLQSEFNQPYFQKLNQFVQDQYNDSVVYPDKELIYEAFNQTHFKDVKVVIIGQDPYHGENQAHGLSFSVKNNNKLPPSLKNIYKELSCDLEVTVPKTGNLTPWAKQGVLLLNATLTVSAKSPGSHQKKGWEIFTDRIIELISNEKENIVFILWGKYAQNKGVIINELKHLTIKSPHPSPFSARRGFFGSQPFSKTNEYLLNKNIKPIDWTL
ncbi:MAG: uracil-DNA glycosylase [Flavobacteriales bacterium]|jgi:uracil-DNA glycosylase|tara:strand:+ start:7749 stop:8426 length:678 start_codon:yes stop_codon:yes gene_type:complete